jgi:hypothetical protein
MELYIAFCLKDMGGITLGPGGSKGKLKIDLLIFKQRGVRISLVLLIPTRFLSGLECPLFLGSLASPPPEKPNT